MVQIGIYMVVELDVEYRGKFNPEPSRMLLCLDTDRKSTLPPIEQIRLGNLLLRGGYLFAHDLIKLRREISTEDNPQEKRVCVKHGEWYHDSFGCLHHDHTNPHPTDRPPIDGTPCDR